MEKGTGRAGDSAVGRDGNGEVWLWLGSLDIIVAHVHLDFIAHIISLLRMPP